MTVVLGVTCLLGGCALNPPEPPGPRIAQAEQAVNDARQADAAEFAALEMKMATDKLQRARYIAGGQQAQQYDKARRLAEEARVDARLAEIKTEASRLSQLKDELARTVELLQNDQ